MLVVIVVAGVVWFYCADDLKLGVGLHFVAVVVGQVWFACLVYSLRFFLSLLFGWSAVLSALASSCNK